MTSALGGAIGWRRTYLLLGLAVPATLPACAFTLRHPEAESMKPPTVA